MNRFLYMICQSNMFYGVLSSVIYIHNLDEGQRNIQFDTNNAPILTGHKRD